MAAIVASTAGKPEPLAHRPIRVRGYYSDVLYAPWLCASVLAGREWTAVDNVDRHNASELSPEMFKEQYERPGKPVVLTNGTASWPASTKWTVEYLVAHSNKATFEATPGPVQLTMAQYWEYARWGA